MGSRFLGVVSVTAGLALAGCGGGGSTSRSGGTPAPKSAPPLNAYVIKAGEEPGYPAQSPAQYTSTRALETAQGGYSAADLRRITAEGFRAAVFEQTGSSEAGLSLVFELGSPADARREEAVQMSQDLRRGKPRSVRFAVPAIPGAVGLAYPSKSGGGGGNVLWREGRCMLLVGDIGATSSYRQPAIAGAKAIWKRTHAVPGACTA